MAHNPCDKLIDYYNGALPEEERQDFETHIAQCDACQEDLKEWESLTETLPYLSKPIEPPEGMKERILNHVLQSNVKPKPQTIAPTASLNTEKNNDETASPVQTAPISKSRSSASMRQVKRLKWLSIGLAAILILSLITNGVFWSINHKMQPLTNGEPTHPISKVIPLQPTKTSHMVAMASFMTNQNKQIMIVQASKLQPLSGNQVYMVWLLKDGKPYPAGYFKPNAQGVGYVAYTMNQSSAKSWNAIAISKEPNSKSQTPKGPVLMQGKL